MGEPKITEEQYEEIAGRIMDLSEGPVDDKKRDLLRRLHRARRDFEQARGWPDTFQPAGMGPVDWDAKYAPEAKSKVIQLPEQKIVGDPEADIPGEEPSVWGRFKSLASDAAKAVGVPASTEQWKAYGRGLADIPSFGAVDEAVGAGAQAYDFMHGETPRVTRGSALTAEPVESDTYTTYREGQRDIDREVDAAEPMNIAPILKMASRLTPMTSAYGELIPDEVEVGPRTVGKVAGAGVVAPLPMGQVAAPARATLAGRALSPAASTALRSIETLLRSGTTVGPFAALQSAGETTADFGTPEFYDDVKTGYGVGTAAGWAIPEAMRAGPALKRLVGRGAEKLAQRADDSATIAMGPRLAETAREGADPLSQKGSAWRALARAGQNPERLAEQQSAVGRSMETIVSADDAARFGRPSARRGARNLREQAARGMDEQRFASQLEDTSRASDEILAGGDVIKETENIASKRPAIERMLAEDQVDPAPAREAAEDVVNRVEEFVDAELGVNEVSKEKTALNRIKRAIATFRNRGAVSDEVAAAGAPTSAADEYMEMDQLKRTIQEEIDSMAGRRGLTGIAKALNEETEPMRLMLQDPDLWGPQAAEFQRARNMAWTDRLRARSPERRVVRDAPEAGAFAFRQKPEANPRGISPLLKDPNSPEAEREVRDFLEMMRRDVKLQEALTQHAESAPEMKQAAMRSRAALDRIERAFRDRSLEVDALERAKRIVDEQGRAFPPGMLERRDVLDVPSVQRNPLSSLVKRADEEGLGAVSRSARQASERLGPAARRAAREVDTTITQRMGEAGAAEDLQNIRTLGQRDTGDATQSWLRRIPKVRDVVEEMARPPAHMADEAQVLADLEAAAPTNPAAAERLKSLRTMAERGQRVRGWAKQDIDAPERAAPREVAAGMAATAAGRSAGRALPMGRPAMSPSFADASPEEQREQLTDETRGHELARVAREALQSSPEVFGRYREDFAEAAGAEDSTMLTALIVKLTQNDPEFRRQVLPRLKAATATQENE